MHTMYQAVPKASSSKISGPRWTSMPSRHRWKTIPDTPFFADQPSGGNICGRILTLFSYLIIFFTLPISVWFCIKIINDYQRAVIFRLGRLIPAAKGPGTNDSNALLRHPPQEILSKDSVTIAVEVVVFFRINNAIVSITNVEDSSRSTRLLAQTTLRNILGTKTVSNPPPRAKGGPGPGLAGC
ncbi:PHB domain-containing protein [Aphelenchoides fujianensis]|nr:PHB domain-containing protein [Aphelenchoides fujianensis]